MSVSKVIRVISICAICTWLIVGVLVVFEIMNPFSEKLMTALMCIVFADNIAKWINKEKKDARS